MEGNPASAWFVGDLGDPWVLAIAEALPRDVAWISRPGDLPEEWASGEVAPPETLVLHRANLNATDAARLGRLIASGGGATRVILCAGPHARHDDLLRWSRLTETVLPEATASETVARHFLRVARVRPKPPLPPVSVVSSDFEWREMMAALCRHAGYVAEPIPDGPDDESDGIVVWDLPVLRGDWPDRLSRRSKRAKVVCLLGFADRPDVTLARQRGAVACLDSPCDLEDIVWTLDRLTTSRSLWRPSQAHAEPTGPAFARIGERNRAKGRSPR